MPTATYRTGTWEADSSFKVSQNCKFENHVTTNDVIMTSLPKTMEKCGPLRDQTNYHSKGIDESYPKMYFSLNLSYYVKSYGNLCQIVAFFTMPALQIWLSHVTQEANFEKILFFPNSAFNIRKSYKISTLYKSLTLGLHSKNVKH